MKSSEILDRFKELNNNNQICCTSSELDSFLVSGLIFKSGSGYITKNLKPVSVQILNPKELNFNIDFNSLIDTCELKAKKLSINKIYCMTTRCYNKYKEKGLIITKGNEDYFRMFDRELWLVHLLD